MLSVSSFKMTKSKNDVFHDKIWLWLIGFALVYCVGVNEQENPKSREKMFQSNIYVFMGIKVYIVFIEEIWVQIYGYFWVQSLCILGACLWLGWVYVCGCWVQSIWILLGACLCLLGACLWLGWVQSMRKLGAKYMDTFGCMSIPFVTSNMSIPFGCMSMDRLGARMRLLSAKYAVVGCMPDSR